MSESDWDITWSAGPEILFHYLGFADRRKFSFPFQFRNFIRGVRASSGPSVHSVGPYISISSSVQHDRVLQPVLGKLSQQYGPITRTKLPVLGKFETLSLLVRAERLSRSIRNAVGKANFEPVSFGVLFGQISVFLARFKILFESRSDLRSVLVATQHGASIRAALRAMNHHPSLKSVYLPHAPLASNVFYSDLPVHFTLLRGAAEFDSYLTLTDQPGRLRVVGDPSKSVPGPSASAGDTYLYVMSDQRHQSIVDEVEILRNSGIGPIEVCPHPRMNRDASFLSLFPPDWTISPYRTTHERLKVGGVRAVIQRDSGAGLDVLQSGIPVINLALSEQPPNYPYLLMPEIHWASTANELTSVSNSIVRSVKSDQQRTSAAERWVAAVGNSALTNIAKELRCILELPQVDALILDTWARH